MKIHPQMIAQNGQPAFVVLPFFEYEALLASVNDAVDIESIELAKAQPSEAFPLELVEKIADGQNPIKLFREYREMKQVDLATSVNVSQQYISQLEANERQGSARILKAIAKTLDVDVDDLIFSGVDKS